MKKNAKILSGKFIAGIVIYAVVFLLLVAVGLYLFWGFIEAYELSRPKNTMQEFMDQLTVEQMCAASDALYDSVDQNLQTREQFDQVIRDAVTGDISYAKKSSESTETRQVFVLRSGRANIGQFTISAGKEDKYGFRRWEVEEYSFDFSYLLGEGVSVTVPLEYQVTVNGKLLDDSYITETGIQYSALEEFYDSLTLPTMVTYDVEGFLGDITIEILDAAGNPVTITSDMDMNALLPQCGADEAGKVEAFANEFVKLWVSFSGSTNDTKGGNYHRLKNILSSDGALAERLYTALDGLTFGQSNGATILEVPINRIVPLGNGEYICDMSYVVRTVGRQGAVDTTSNMKLLMVTENGELRVKAMERY